VEGGVDLEWICGKEFKSYYEQEMRERNRSIVLQKRCPACPTKRVSCKNVVLHVLQKGVLQVLQVLQWLVSSLEPKESTYLPTYHLVPSAGLLQCSNLLELFMCVRVCVCSTSTNMQFLCRTSHRTA
jgi:hypothetical protein